MLATYPVEATAENWLSDCLASRLLSRLEQLEAGGEIVEFPSDFDEELREVIESYPRVTKRFKSLSDAFAGLTPEQRVIVRNAIESQNQIPEVFDTAFPCTDCGEELPDIQKLAKELFEFSFGALSRIKSPNSDVPIRDRHYEIAYGHLQKKCCPFCGMERLEPYHPDVPRHDLDHYLAISRYLFSGTNLKNLTAMGDRCNSSYKLALDILYDPNGNRLPCYDPYGDVTASFSLEGSELFGGHGGVRFGNCVSPLRHQRQPTGVGYFG
jgi:hypothetical protein